MGIFSRRGLLQPRHITRRVRLRSTSKHYFSPRPSSLGRFFFVFGAAPRTESVNLPFTLLAFPTSLSPRPRSRSPPTESPPGATPWLRSTSPSLLLLLWILSPTLAGLLLFFLFLLTTTGTSCSGPLHSFFSKELSLASRELSRRRGPTLWTVHSSSSDQPSARGATRPFEAWASRSYHPSRAAAPGSVER